jgi:hypothetical protein
MSKPVGLLVVVLLTFSVLGARAEAQSGLGTVTSDGLHVGGCPMYGGNNFFSLMTCYDGHETSCPNTAEATPPATFTFIYGVATPTAPIGTIVFLSGGKGTTPSLDAGTEETFAGDYYYQHYQVVQIAWHSDWEDNGLAAAAKSIGSAACRPASFLSWVYNNLYLPIQANKAQAGMCAQGNSAGSGALAYTLAWYGGGSGTNGNLLDKVTLLNGPVFSDIEKGCGVYEYIPSVTVCPSGQFGCNPANVPSSWSLRPVYSDAAPGMQTWTGDSTCAGSNYTSTQSNENWKDMSIVDDGVNGQFSYPKTKMTA